MRIGLGLGLTNQLRAVGGAFSPASLSPLVWYDDLSTLYSDTGGTTPVTADASSVRRIADRSGNGYDASLISGSTAASLKTSVYGKRCVRCAASAFTLGQPAGLDTVLNGSRNWSFFALLKKTDTSDRQFFWQGTTRTNFQLISPGGGRVTWGHQNTNADLPSTNTTVPFSVGWTPYVGLGAGSDVGRVSINGAPVASETVIAASGASGGVDFCLGGLDPGNYRGYDLSADVLAFAIFSPALSSLDMLRVSDYYFDRFGVTNPRAGGRAVIYQGNSISVLNQSPQLPEQVRSNLSKPVGTVFQFAQTSKATNQIILENPLLVDPIRAYLVGRGEPAPVYVQWEGVNDTSVQHMWDDFDARVAAGWEKARCVVGTTIAKSTAADPNWNANVRTPNNVLIHANYTSHCGQVADPSSDSVLGATGSPGMGDAATSPDGTHLTQAGSALAVPYFATAVTAASA